MNIRKTGWLLSILFSLLFLGATLHIWYKTYTTYDYVGDLADVEQAKQFLKKNWEDKHPNLPALSYIPTGVYIDSLYFSGSHTVNIAGCLWQSYDKIKHKGVERKFLFADVVNSQSERVRLMRQYDDGKEEHLAWCFEVSLRQHPDRRKYPFDHETIALKILPVDINVIFLPDYKSYNSTATGIFGVSKHLKLPGFRVHETYFSYSLASYDTNFGIKDFDTTTGFPDLTFNMVLSRNIFQGVIFHLLPLFAVIILTFLFLSISTHNKHKVEKYSFRTAGILGSCAALFFILVLSNLKLREEFAGSDIVFIEYFFILGYVMTVYVAINSVLLNIENHIAFIRYQDNLLPKILYWPFLTGMAWLISFLVLCK